MKTNALLIFTRNPELGKVKTRLAKTIGQKGALHVYIDLLKHTLEQTQNINCDKYVFYDTEIIAKDIWPSSVYHKELQAEGDLGQKMAKGFELLFKKGYDRCIIIGSDLFDLKSELIETAFSKLEENEVVLGPAEDGGYYLLGIKQMNPNLFVNKNWGTDTVLRDTLADLKNHRVHLLPVLNDIDTYEDLLASGYPIPNQF